MWRRWSWDRLHGSARRRRVLPIARVAAVHLIERPTERVPGQGDQPGAQNDRDESHRHEPAGERAARGRERQGAASRWGTVRHRRLFLAEKVLVIVRGRPRPHAPPRVGSATAAAIRGPECSIDEIASQPHRHRALWRQCGTAVKRLARSRARRAMERRSGLRSSRHAATRRRGGDQARRPALRVLTSDGGRNTDGEKKPIEVLSAGVHPYIVVSAA